MPIFPSHTLMCKLGMIHQEYNSVIFRLHRIGNSLKKVDTES